MFWKRKSGKFRGMDSTCWTCMRASTGGTEEGQREKRTSSHNLQGSRKGRNASAHKNSIAFLSTQTKTLPKRNLHKLGVVAGTQPQYQHSGGWDKMTWASLGYTASPCWKKIQSEEQDTGKEQRKHTRGWCLSWTQMQSSSTGICKLNLTRQRYSLIHMTRCGWTRNEMLAQHLKIILIYHINKLNKRKNSYVPSIQMPWCGSVFSGAMY